MEPARVLRSRQSLVTPLTTSNMSRCSDRPSSKTMICCNTAHTRSLETRGLPTLSEYPVFRG